MINSREIAYKVRVKLNSTFVEKCLGDKYLRDEPILYIRDHKPYEDERGKYVNISGRMNSGRAYLTEIDLEFEVDGNGIPIPTVTPITKQQADDIIRKFRLECLPFGEYPDYVINEFIAKHFPQ